MKISNPDDSGKSGPQFDSGTQDLPSLCKLWKEAVADESDGLDSDAVLDRLESKYEKAAKATGQ
jgi:hypothetical protein